MQKMGVNLENIGLLDIEVVERIQMLNHNDVIMVNV
jgi:hypothetical protein